MLLIINLIMIIFTDGSTFNNGKKNAIGGIGVYIPQQKSNDEYKLSYSLLSTDYIKVTNQVAELIAIILGIEHALTITKETIYVYTDSKYCIDCATTWSKAWINNNWKKSNGKIVENLWLIYRLVQLTKKNPIIFKHINAHTDEPSNKSSEEYNLWFGNNTVDNLAQNASQDIIQLNENAKILRWDTFSAFLINGMKTDIKCKLNIPFIDEISEFHKKIFNNNPIQDI